MVCTWREGYQSFPPRKSASLNAKNKSSSMLSNGYHHQLKIWVTSFSCWEEGAHKEGRFSHFLRTKDGSVGFHQLCLLLVSASFFCTDRWYWAACRALPGCCLFWECCAWAFIPARATADFLQATHFHYWTKAWVCCLLPLDNQLLPFFSFSGQ